MFVLNLIIKTSVKFDYCYSVEDFHGKLLKFEPNLFKVSKKLSFDFLTFCCRPFRIFWNILEHHKQEMTLPLVVRNVKNALERVQILHTHRKDRKLRFM